jgi:large subunit ribosomal protein L18
MIKQKHANKARLRRHQRVRKKVAGTPERPRLCVYRSSKEIYAQIVDDAHGTTLVAASSRDADIAQFAPAAGASSVSSASSASSAAEDAGAGAGRAASRSQRSERSAGRAEAAAPAGRARGGRGGQAAAAAAPAERDGGKQDGDPLAGIAENRRVAQARQVGRLVAERAKAHGITKVVFDRGGYIYHGRVAALATGAREGGLEF